MESTDKTALRLILDIQKGSGFNFLKQPIVISSSLINHTIETDPKKPSHNVIFESKLIWETDKETFHKLQQSNSPIKLEASCLKLNGRKEQIGYLLLSLNNVVPCNKKEKIFSRHKLLGVKPEGKSSNPQLYLRLLSDDCNEISNCPAMRNAYVSNEKVDNSRECLSTTDALTPRICLSTKTIEIGSIDECYDTFEIQLCIRNQSSTNLLLKTNNCDTNNTGNIYTLLIFSQILKIDQEVENDNCIKILIKSNIITLSKYFQNSPYAVLKISKDKKDIGASCFDIRKLIPTNDLKEFLDVFCNQPKSYGISERCFFVSNESGEIPMDKDGKKPFVDINITLKYLNDDKDDVKTNSVNNTPTKKSIVSNNKPLSELNVHSSESSRKSSVCEDVADKNESDEAIKVAKNFVLSVDHQKFEQSIINLDNNIDTIIKKLNLLSPSCSTEPNNRVNDNFDNESNENRGTVRNKNHFNKNIIKKTSVSFENNADNTDDDRYQLSPRTKEINIMRMINELEDWKECQEEMFKSDLKEKEEKYFNILKNEWELCRNQYEDKLVEKIEHCQFLLNSLKDVVENLKLREIQFNERERKLHLAKDEFELHYRNKYQELKDAAKQMEIDYQHQLKLHKLEYSKLEMEMLYLKQENASLKEKVKSYNDTKHK